MIVPCFIEEIIDNEATLYDYKNKREYKVQLTDEDKLTYLNTTNIEQEYEIPRNAKAKYELEYEEMNSIVFYDTETKKLTAIPNEDSIDLFY